MCDTGICRYITTKKKVYVGIHITFSLTQYHLGIDEIL